MKTTIHANGWDPSASVTSRYWTAGGSVGRWKHTLLVVFILGILIFITMFRDQPRGRPEGMSIEERRGKAVEQIEWLKDQMKSDPGGTMRKRQSTYAPKQFMN